MAGGRSAVIFVAIIDMLLVCGSPLHKRSLQSPVKCLQRPKYDIFFVVDGSRSITEANFEKVRDFLKHIIHYIDVGPDANHVGLIQFSEERMARVEFDFSYKQEKDAILARLQRLRYHSGRSTFTGAALKIVVDSIYPATGGGNNRLDANNILVIFTDGQAHDSKEAKEYAEKLKKRGVRIIVIGAGDWVETFIDDLKRMASGPSDVYTVSFANLTAVAESIAGLTRETCLVTEKLPTSARPTTAGQTETTHTSFTMTRATPTVPEGTTTTLQEGILTAFNQQTPEPTKPRTLEPNGGKCKQEPHDIFLAVDGSWGSGDVDFQKVKEFLKRFVSSVDVSPLASHIGLMQFSQSDMVTAEVTFQSSQAKRDILERIQRLEYQDGSATYTGKALEAIEGRIFTGSDGDRPNVKDLLVLVSYGYPYDPWLAEDKARELKERGVHIVVIGVGLDAANVIDEMKYLATEPEEMRTSTFENLPNISNYLAEMICQEKPSITSTETLVPTTKPPSERQTSAGSPDKVRTVAKTRLRTPSTLSTTLNEIPTTATTLTTASEEMRPTTTLPKIAKGTTITSSLPATIEELTTNARRLPTTVERLTTAAEDPTKTATKLSKTTEQTMTVTTLPKTTEDTTTVTTLPKATEETTTATTLSTTDETTTPKKLPIIIETPTVKALLITAEETTTATTLLSTTTEETTTATTFPSTTTEETTTATTFPSTTTEETTTATTLSTTTEEAKTATTFPTTTDEATTATKSPTPTDETTTTTTSRTTTDETTTTFNKTTTVTALPTTNEDTTTVTTLPTIAEETTTTTTATTLVKTVATTLPMIVKQTKITTPLSETAEETASYATTQTTAEETTSAEKTATVSTKPTTNFLTLSATAEKTTVATTLSTNGEKDTISTTLPTKKTTTSETSPTLTGTSPNTIRATRLTSTTKATKILPVSLESTKPKSTTEMTTARKTLVPTSEITRTTATMPTDFETETKSTSSQKKREKDATTQKTDPGTGDIATAPTRPVKFRTKSIPLTRTSTTRATLFPPEERKSTTTKMSITSRSSESLPTPKTTEEVQSAPKTQSVVTNSRSTNLINAGKPNLADLLAGCSQSPRDILVAVDGAASVEETNFTKLLRFLQSLVTLLDLRPGKVRIGLLEFGNKDETQVFFGLDSSLHQNELLSKIREMPYHNSAGRYVGSALRVIDKSIFTGTGGDRPAVEDLLVIFMGGRTDDASVASEFSEKLKVKGVHIMAVAIGSQPDTFMDHIELIASSVDDIRKVSYEDIDSIGTVILGDVCELPSNSQLLTKQRKAKLTDASRPAAPTLTTLRPYVATTSTATTNPSKRPSCAIKSPKDVLFMVETTENIERRSFLKVMEFISFAIRRMHRRDNSFLTGIMEFGGQNAARMIMDLSTEINYARLDQSLKMSAQNGFKRFTGQALTEASKKLYGVNTARKRYNAQDVIILITYGKAEDKDKMKREVELLKARSIKIIVIALGKMRQQTANEWTAIVNATYVFTSEVHSQAQLFEEIWDPVCSEDYYRKNYPPRYLQCDAGPRDVFFVADGSRSIKYTNFRNVRKLIQDLVILFQSQNQDLNFGIMQFSEALKTNIPLRLGKHSLGFVLDVVQSMVYQSGQRTDTGNALSRVSTEVFNKFGGDRPFVDDILILLTDGNAHDLLLARQMADAMKIRNIKIVCIGAGPDSKVRGFREELESMASNKKDVITVDFPELPTFASKVLQVACENFGRY